uniref:Putative secreted protein n=1 Tax=Ixodes ricinus TaxID=34613 RepID=A0A6B0UA03_IXORI
MVCFMSTLLMLCSMAYFLALVTISSCSGESFMSPKPMSGGDALRAPGPANTGPICSCCRLPSSFPLGPSASNARPCLSAAVGGSPDKAAAREGKGAQPPSRQASQYG